LENIHLSCKRFKNLTWNQNFS